MIKSIRHTGLVVRDLDRAIRLYEALGLRIWQRANESGQFIETVVGIPNVTIQWAKLKCPDGSLLELLQYHSHPDIRPLENAPANRLGCSHVAFTVRDIVHACKEIVRIGGSVINSPAASPDGRVKVVYCHDPEGILLELVEEVGQDG